MSVTDPSHLRPRPRWLVTALLFTVFLAAVALFYVFVASAGHMTGWPTWTAYYDNQAEGFRAGHLYTTIQPSPALKALADPLDVKNMHFWRWDYSYYQGHIYIYWGLLPPAILAAVKVLFGIRHIVADDPLVFAFLVVQAAGGALLVRAMARRLTPRPPSWSIGLAMAVLALAHPTPYLLARPAVYEGAIAGGSCFMVLALACIFQSLFAARATTGLRWLMLASLCGGLAGACRVNLLPAVAATLTAAALGRWRAGGGGWRRLARLAPLAAAPVSVITFGHLWLNKLRFGAWSEFGQNYQMGFRWFPFGERFLPSNLFVYLFRPPTRSCRFPFFTAEWGYPPDLFPSWLPLDCEYRVNEPTAGIFLVAPVLCFLLALPLAAGLPPFDRMTPGALASSARWRWFLAVAAVAAASTMAVPMLVGAATMRYQGDFAPMLLLLALVGSWAWLEAARARRRPARQIAVSILGLLSAGTIVVGMLFGFTGYFQNFERHNPALMRKLQDNLSLCDR